MKAKGLEKERSGVTDKSQLYLVGGGIAGLSAAVFAIRDGHIPGKNIHIFEVMNVMGGALDGAGSPDKYFVVRGARKVNLEAFQCMWDLLSGIPSIPDPKISVKEEVFEFNRIHKKNVKSRLIDKDGNKTDIPEFGPMTMSNGDRIRLLSLLFVPESWIENRRIDSWFAPSFFETNFWKCFFSTFAIETWNDLVEMKRYMRRFLHDFPKLGMGGGEMVFPYNQYDSIVLPIINWLKAQSINFEMGCKVNDLDLNPSQDELTVEKIHYTQNGENKEIVVNKGDFVFVTNGSMVADSRRGSMNQAAALETGKIDGSWTLWENLAKKRSGLGNPSNFCDHIDQSKWLTFSVTNQDRTFVDMYEKFTGNKPGQADMVTFKDSNWHMSILVPDHPHFPNQPENMYFWGGCGLITDKEGNFVKKKMSECNGQELLKEMCGHFGFKVEMEDAVIETSNCIPNMMPYEMSHFLPRKKSDRPPVVPKGSTNLAFLGQFVESGECVMLVESSVRCGQMAVYALLNVDKKVPPVYTAVHNPAVLYRAVVQAFK